MDTKMILDIYPEAVLVSHDVLLEAGWTTQLSFLTYIAVLKRDAYLDIPGVNITPRSQTWFDLVAPYLVNHRLGLPALTPALALANYGIDGWHMDLVSLQVEDEGWKELEKAYNLFGLEMPREYVNRKI